MKKGLWPAQPRQSSAACVRERLPPLRTRLSRIYAEPCARGDAAARCNVPYPFRWRDPKTVHFGTLEHDSFADAISTTYRACVREVFGTPIHQSEDYFRGADDSEQRMFLDIRAFELSR